MDALRDELLGKLDNKIAFTIPVSSVVGRVSFELLLGGKGEQ